MNRVNMLILYLEDCASKEEWEDEIKNSIMAIANAKCIMTAVLEEAGKFVIKFNPVDTSYGRDYPYWLSSEEYNRVIFEAE